MKKKPLTQEELTECATLKALLDAMDRSERPSQAEMGEMMGGISQGAVSHYLVGRNPLNLQAAIAFSRILKKPISAFSPRLAKLLTAAEGQNLTDNVKPGPAVRGSVPLISWVQAGEYATIVDNYAPGDGEKFIPVTCPVKRHTFALRVKGDSMEPIFPEGTILIIEPDFEPMPGDYVIVRTNGDEATFKQLVKDGGDYYLKPLNPRYPIKPLPADAEICGVARSATFEFR